MQIQTLTFEQLLVAIAVILLLIDIYNKIMTAVKNAREEKKRRSQPVNTLEDTVNDVYRRYMNIFSPESKETD